MSGKLHGKVAVVTGSGRGIGRAIALKLASEGARLVLNDLDDEPAAAVREEILKMGGEAVVCCGNVAAVDFADRLFSTTTEAFNGLDILINNAGYTWELRPPASLRRFRYREWDTPSCSLNRESILAD